MKRFAMIAAAAALALATSAHAQMGSLANPQYTAPAAYNPPDASGTITAGGTFQTVFAANPLRTGCFVQNPVAATETLKLHFQSSAATTANSFDLGAGASFNCQWGGAVITGQVQVEAATTGHAFAAAGQ